MLQGPSPEHMAQEFRRLVDTMVALPRRLTSNGDCLGWSRSPMQQFLFVTVSSSQKRDFAEESASVSSAVRDLPAQGDTGARLQVRGAPAFRRRAGIF